MELAQIAELGGLGAAAQVVTRLLGMAAANRERVNASIDKQNADTLGRWEKVQQMLGDTGGKWVYRMFAGVSMFIVISPLVLPFFGDVVLHWYVPKAGSWWIWDKAQMIEHVVGNPTEASRHLALFPYMYSFASNVVWFYICGKPLKHRF